MTAYLSNRSHITLWVLGTLLILIGALPFFAHAEYIETFETHIHVGKDGSLTVSETIDYRFSEARHGIFREIPIVHPEASSAFFKDRIIEVKLKDVRMDGNTVPYTNESSREKFSVRIGDPQSTIQGRHLYTIEYVIHGGLSYPKGEGVELYWDVTGNDWVVPIRVVNATISADDGLFRGVRSCYSGTLGSTSGSCSTTQNEDGSINFRVTEVMPGEGMTIAQSLDIARVNRDIRERTNFVWFIIPLFGIALLYGGWRIYRYNTAFKTGDTIIPQYEPYADVKPMYSGILMDGQLDPRDITAGIVYLAEQGYLKIKKVERKVFFLFEVDDYELRLVKVPDDTLSSFEKRVLELLFTELREGAVITLSGLKDRSEQQKNYIAFTSLKNDLREDLASLGFFEHFSIQRMFIIFGTIVVIALIGGLLVTGEISVVIIVGMVFVAILSMVVLNRRRTRKGYEALDHLKGFKLFLEMTDRDRYAFHNAPEKSPEQFMEYLPFAIAFGVEKQWAKVFEGITIPNPDWFQDGKSGFSPQNLSSSLGAFSTTFASHTSAAAGGGSSGGGAGGGGGGSW